MFATDGTLTDTGRRDENELVRTVLEVRDVLLVNTGRAVRRRQKAPAWSPLPRDSRILSPPWRSS
jgi:hypothetical protein